MKQANAQPTDVNIPQQSLWTKLPGIGVVAAVLGLGAILGAATGEHKARALFSYLWAFEFFLSIALGGLAFTLLEHITRSGWSVVVRRVSETAMAVLPLFLLLWIPIGTLGFHDLFPWTHEHDEVLESKRWFLNSGFFFGRAALYLVVWVVLSRLLYKHSLAQDATNGSAESAAPLTRRLWRISAVGILLYALTQSFQAVDWIMSLQPHWYSTIMGVYFFAGSILSFFAFTILVVLGLQRAGVLSSVTQEHFHDLGKYLFGFTVFWGYIAFSQFLIIWYGNIPEETVFYNQRLAGGWEWISYGLPLFHFFIPFFFLLSRHVKRNRVALAVAACWTLVAHALDLYWFILPNFGAHGGGHEPHLAWTWTDAAALLGIGGAFAAVFASLLVRNKVLCVGDPRLSESLVHENY